MKKCIFVSLFTFCFIIATNGLAHSKTYRISVSQFVEHPALDATLKGFQDYLKETGVDVKYQIHNAQANMPVAGQIATQIMGEKPDLILAIATPTSQSIAQVLKKTPHMKNTPFLFSAVTDPVSAGLVNDLQRPGGNITGVSDMLPIDKHMAMVKEFYPGLKKLGVLYNAGEANSKKTVEMINETGKKMKFKIIDATASKSSEVYQAAKSIVGRADAIFVPTDNTVVTALEAAVKVCVQNRLALFCADVNSVERGAVAAMGFDYYKHGYQTGAMAKRIFEGADPSETPVETQEELQLHINQKYADLMGVKIPQTLITRANKIYKD